MISMTIEVFSERKKVLGINSLGRIGKLTLWHHVGRRYFDAIVVNQGREIGTSLEAVAQFIEKDSTYGQMHRFLYGIYAKPMIKIVDESAGKLMIGETPVTILRQARNPKDIPWREHGVEVVTECTGKFIDPTINPEDAKGSIRGHLIAGARVVINSSAFKIKNRAASMPDDAVTLIYGINHGAFDPARHVVLSAASCTTTGLAHMVKPLLENAATSVILTASMTTVHAATNTQSVLDSVPGAGDKDLRKSRSFLNNIILTSTNAAEALSQVIPEVQDIGFMADSIRIPTSTESLIILNATFQSSPEQGITGNLISRESINALYRQTAGTSPLLHYSDAQNVSSDMAGTDAAVVIEGQFNHTRTAFIKADLSQIAGLPEEVLRLVPGGKIDIPVVHAKIFGWYDNEFGSYTNRLGDLTVHAHKSLR
ncbi:MAG TPA: glyceraldehyde 3-phosphate dehydrogenase NAD-binding domain-containing protein [Candidatus Rifleibacterium sp.]|nr:glyceraldehyde 3-phosphate dehydrogenase NAD-binding domain-containing protein [Candidatus Rifleibacterium sp.]HPW59471.1 glyceraldehyde 3-phosphate dehydrogenase NAD-binding domain-containing protein [Candidatus Rifleibacterium sp.]